MAALNPQEALAAVRSFPRRLREVLEPHDDDVMAVDDLAATGSPSALTQAGVMALQLGAVAPQLKRIRFEDTPALPRWVSGTGPLTVRQAVAAVEEAAAAAADMIQRYDEFDWLRTATVDGDLITAVALLRDRVDEAGRALREAERAMAHARRS